MVSTRRSKKIVSPTPMVESPITIIVSPTPMVESPITISNLPAQIANSPAPIGDPVVNLRQLAEESVLRMQEICLAHFPYHNEGSRKCCGFVGCLRPNTRPTTFCSKVLIYLLYIFYSYEMCS